MIAAGPQQSQGPRGTVLVANMDDDSVWLIDLPSGTLRATLPTRIAPHEVATSNEGTMPAVTNYGDERGPGNLIQTSIRRAPSLRHGSRSRRRREKSCAFYPPEPPRMASTSSRFAEGDGGEKG